MAQHPNYLPTPTEIELECARIRRDWTPRERRERRIRAQAVLPMLVSTAEIAADCRREHRDLERVA